MGVHQDNLESVCFKDFEKRYPVDACGFHGDRGHTDFPEPLREPAKIGGETLKPSNGHVVTLGRRRNNVKGGSDIDAGSVGMDNGER